MLILFVILSIAAIILVAVDGKTESTRCLVGVCMFSALGSFGAVIQDDVLPYLSAYLYSSSYIMVIIKLLGGLFLSFGYYLAPTALLIYGIVFSDLYKGKWNRFKKRVIYMLMIPTFIMYFFVPVYPTFIAPPIPTSTWVTPYVLLANSLMTFSIVKTKQPSLRQQKLMACIVVMPGTMMSLFTNYLLPAFNISGTSKYNAVLIVIQFCAFVFFGVKRGVLGVKFAFERHYIDKSIKSVALGTSLLNHTIKNEVMKISMCMNNIQCLTAQHNSSPELNESIEIVNESANYLSTMVNKIQSQTKEIVLEEKPCELSRIINDAIKLIMPLITQKNIEIARAYKDEYILQCDGVHLQEALRNILNNAIEAMGIIGTVTIDLIQKNKKLVLSIADNGPGISKENLPHVIDPLFSTKHRTNNFGLGLTYCYSVMQQHGGSLEVESEQGQGTRVLLSFPSKRILKTKSVDSLRGGMNGEDKGCYC